MANFENNLSSGYVLRFFLYDWILIKGSLIFSLASLHIKNHPMSSLLMFLMIWVGQECHWKRVVVLPGKLLLRRHYFPFFRQVSHLPFMVWLSIGLFLGLQNQYLIPYFRLYIHIESQFVKCLYAFMVHFLCFFNFNFYKSIYTQCKEFGPSTNFTPVGVRPILD